MKISKNTFLSPAGLFVIYMALSFLAIMGFRMLFPGEPEPLAFHGRTWRLIQGIITFITLFPALTMAGLVLPFGLKARQDGEFERFSEAFLDQVKPSVFAAIGAIACYGLLFFLVFPLAQSLETTMRSEGFLFTASKEKALSSAEKGAWPEAAQFIAVCDQIWPDSPEIEALRTDALMGIEAWRISQADAQLEAWVKGDMYQDMMATYSRLDEGNRQPVNAALALSLADKAMQAERYFDAHWLASLGERLARQGSVERLAGNQLANHAWDAVTSLKPNAREQRIYDLYRKKREGYEAMMGENWIKAYYIFKELAVETPGDPDVDRFLAISEGGAKGKAFFIDEIELTLGEILSSAIFSFPLGLAEENRKGRMVLRFGSLSTAPDFSYGMDLELMAFDPQGTLLYQMRTGYVKIIPLSQEEGPRLMFMFKALDRLDETKRHEPEWQGSPPQAARNGLFTINLAYDDFLVLARLGWGLEPILIGDLMGMAKRIGAYGYIPELFQAEILNRFSETAFFLPMTMLIIVIGWRYRSKKTGLSVGIPMLVVLPLIFNGVVFLCRSMLHSLSVWSVIFWDFSTAIAVFTIGIVIFLILTLILLSAQKG